MTEKITSLRAQRGGATATTLCRKWQALPKSMKSNALRLLLLLAILFIPAMRANAEEWDMITCLNVSQDLRQSQTSDKGLATITMTNNSWFYWEQKKSDPWAGLMHFTRTQDKKGEGYHAEFKISAKEGYYITKVIFRDTEGCGKYSNELGLTRLTMYSTQSSEYDRKFDEYSLDNYVDASKKGKYQDNNNLVFENTDDNPLQSITFWTQDKGYGDQFKCRMIMVVCKKVRDCMFSKEAYSLRVGENINHIFESQTLGSNLPDVSFNFSDKSIVNISKDATNGYVAKGMKSGVTVVVASLPSDNDYVKYSGNASFTVRYDQPATVSTSLIKMNAWDTRDVPAVQHLPTDYTGKVNWKSSDESIAKIVNGKIVFGGTGYGKTATFTADLPQDFKYNAVVLSFGVTVNNEILIANKADWDKFCQQVNSGNGSIKATLTANITTPVTISAGSEFYPYSGTFEGDNHSIALNLSGGDYTAPFLAAGGATIRNLNVTGGIAASGRFAGSLVGLVKGNAVTIDHCQSSVAITSSSTNTLRHDAFFGGLVGRAINPVKINNCIFSGSMTGAKESRCGGLVGGLDNGGNTITNCLITATYAVNAIGFNAVVAGNAKNVTISNVYILNPLGTMPAGAEQVSAEQIKSGYAAYKLQNGQTTQSPQVWGQTVNASNGDAAPVFSTDTKKRVWTATFRLSSNNSKILAVRYLNPGQTPADLTQEEIVAYIQDTAPKHYITYQKPSIGAQGNADRYIDVTFPDKEYLEINSADTWKAFCDYVDIYNNKVSARMTSDVTLDASSPMAGVKQRYAGHFDGAFHTLTVAYQGTAQATAPFYQVEDGVIENLKTAGTVEQTGTGKSDEYHASGLVGSAYGVTFNNCEVAVELIFNQSTQVYSGGFVGHGHALGVTMNNCKFSGKFNGKAGNIVGVSGFVGWSTNAVNISNCYVGGTYTNVTGVHPLVYSADKPTVTGDNNYYCFTPAVDNYRTYGAAKAVTADEAKSGSVTYALQHGTGAQYWSQNLPGDTVPMLAYTDVKTVNKAEFVYNDAVKATRYANTGNAVVGGVPTLKDFMGSDYSDSYYYETFTFNPALTNDSPVNADARITVDIKYSDFVTINSKATWEKFCAYVNDGGNKVIAKMTADVTDAVTTMAGTSGHPYQGIFDGQGYTLSLNLNSTAEGAAPFSYIDGATVKGLRTTGMINTSAKFAGGIVGLVNNNLSTVTDCQSDVTINSTINGDGTHGGIVGLGNAPVYIENCAFYGNISGSATNNCAGILGWAGAAGNTIKNCLFTGKLTVKDTRGENSDPIARNNGNVEISNTYYLNTPHTASKGEQVNEAQLRSGEIAHKLQGAQETQHWGQQLPNDNVPQLTSDAAKKVRAVRFICNGNPFETLYANNGGTVAGELPGVAKIRPFISNYDRSHYYMLAFSSGFSASTVVNSDMDVTVSYTENDYFHIANGDDWNYFAEYVKEFPYLNGALTADILAFDMTVVGSEAVPYKGTFDGREHTINMNLNATSNGAAPFSYVDGATITRLRTAGTITTSAKYAGGIVGVVKKNRSTISNCQSDVTINSTIADDATHGGIVGLGDGAVTIENCVFNGNINGPESWNCAGILGWAGRNDTQIRNCLFTGKLNVKTDMAGENSDPIARNFVNVVVSNTYYLETPHKQLYTIPWGKQVTEEQLKNGNVASMLQGDQEKPYWGFYLGGGTNLLAFQSDESEMSQKYNYIYWDQYRNGWRCDLYKLTDGEAYQDSYVDFSADGIIYLRSLTAGRRYTWYQPYTVAMSEELPFKAYKLSGYSGGNAIFNQLEGNDSLVAFTPYLIMMNESTESLNFQKKTIVKHHVDNDSIVQQGDIKMMGTLKRISNSEADSLGAYIMQDDGNWKKVMKEKDATAYIPSFRAYLCSTGMGLAHPTIGSVFSDITTGVGNIILKDNDGTMRIYDLQGIDRGTDLNSLPSGIYIRGGKKIRKR